MRPSLRVALAVGFFLGLGLQVALAQPKPPDGKFSSLTVLGVLRSSSAATYPWGSTTTSGVRAFCFAGINSAGSACAEGEVAYNPAADSFTMYGQGANAAVTALMLNASAASGSNGFALQTNGARVDFGAGASDYASSDGTTVTFAGPIAATSATLSGALTTTREFVVDKVSSGIGAGSLLAAGTNYSGWKLPQAWTATHVSINVTTASTATVANTVFTITDGTNTCTATYACNTVTNTAGVKDVATANGAGTGCVYAASALVTISVTTQGCATAATVNSITTWGKPQ